MNNEFKGIHHFYIGLVLLLIGFILIWKVLWLAIFLLIVGLILIIDDAYQHIIQRWKPEYLSPLHKVYGKIYRKYKWIRKLNKFFDKLFGRDVQ